MLCVRTLKTKKSDTNNKLILVGSTFRLLASVDRPVSGRKQDCGSLVVHSEREYEFTDADEK